MIVDCAVYEDGRRRPGSIALEKCAATAKACSNGFAWIGLAEPTEEEFAAVTQEFDLHPLAVEDAIHAQQRPKVELYDNMLFVVLKPARYVDSEEVVELDQIMAFVGQSFVVTVRHGRTDAVATVRRTVDASPELLEWGPLGVLHALCDKVVDDYSAVANGLEGDIAEIERQVFSDDRENHAERIYFLKREVLQFRGAVAPLAAPIEELSRARSILPATSRTEYFRDVHDHVLRVADRIENLDALLTSALNANLAQVGVRQNEDMRKISAWVAIMAVPTMLAGIYGMNFDTMPELRWEFGYPLVLAVMLTACLFLHRMFKRSGWL